MRVAIFHLIILKTRLNILYAVLRNFRQSGCISFIKMLTRVKLYAWYSSQSVLCKHFILLFTFSLLNGNNLNKNASSKEEESDNIKKNMFIINLQDFCFFISELLAEYKTYVKKTSGFSLHKKTREIYNIVLKTK